MPKLTIPRRLAAFAAALLLSAAPAAAQQFQIGIGADDLRGEGTAATFGVEYRSAPLGALGTAPVRFGIAGEVDTRGDFWAGAGPALSVPLGEALLLDASIMPGVAAGDADGSDFALRSRLGLSVPIAAGWRGAFILTHRSNVDDQISIGFGVSAGGY
jgi:hypothetical protein